MAFRQCASLDRTYHSYDLLRDNDGTWRISESNAGNIGGQFRIEYLGVAEVRVHIVNWLHSFARRQRETSIMMFKRSQS